MAKILSIAILLCLSGIPIVNGICYNFEENLTESVKFLIENFQDWGGLLISYTYYDQPQGHETVYEYLHRLGQIYEDIHDLYHKLTSSSEYEKFSKKMKARNILRMLADEVIPMLTIKYGPKAFAEQLGSIFHNKISIAADCAQLILEYYFCAKELGSWVGFTGSIVGGAVSGCVAGCVAGPIGAVVGGAFGYGVWKYGEVTSSRDSSCYTEVVRYSFNGYSVAGLKALVGGAVGYDGVRFGKVATDGSAVSRYSAALAGRSAEYGVVKKTTTRKRVTSVAGAAGV